MALSRRRLPDGDARVHITVEFPDKRETVTYEIKQMAGCIPRSRYTPATLFAMVKDGLTEKFGRHLSELSGRR